MLSLSEEQSHQITAHHGRISQIYGTRHRQ